MDGKKRIGIYGGTFDPVHLGHIEVARRVAVLFKLDEIVFVPALLAPHKLECDVTSPLHRYAMLILATENEPGWKVSTFELDAADRRYTVDTVAHFQKQFGTAELFFIMGADSWSEITTWREWERLLSEINHIVVTRPGFEVRTDHIPSAVRERIRDVRGNTRGDETGKNGPGMIFFTDVVMKDVSATEVRRAARTNRFEELERGLPAAVAYYIKKYSLYRDTNEA